MIYNQLIEKIRSRASLFSQNKEWESGVIYDAINDTIRGLPATIKIEASVNLSIVVGTRDYTISTAIGADVDQIVQIQMDVGEIVPRTIWEFQKEIHQDVTDEDDIILGTPEFYRVWDGVLRLYPTPTESKTAVVYYTKKIAQGFYSTAVGATTVPIEDRYITALIYEVQAILCEILGEQQKSQYYRQIGLEKLNEQLASKPNYSFGETITYQGV